MSTTSRSPLREFSSSPHFHKMTCFLCKEEFVPAVDFECFNNFQAQEKKSVVNFGVSLICKRLKVTFPNCFGAKSTTISTSKDTETCDECYETLKELVQLQNVLEETERKISETLALISGKVGITEQLTQDASFNDNQDFSPSVILPHPLGPTGDIDIKSEPPDVFVDQDFDDSIVVDLDDYNIVVDDSSKSPRSRKRKLHFDELVVSTNVPTSKSISSPENKKCKRSGPNPPRKPLNSGNAQGFEVRIQNKKRKTGYTLALANYLPSKVKSELTANDEPSLSSLPRVVVQDFLTLLPHKYTGLLKPFTQCKYRVKLVGGEDIEVKGTTLKKEVSQDSSAPKPGKTRPGPRSQKNHKKKIKSRAIEKEVDSTNEDFDLAPDINLGKKSKKKLDADFIPDDGDDASSFDGAHDDDGDWEEDEEEPKPKKKRNRAPKNVSKSKSRQTKDPTKPKIAREKDYLSKMEGIIDPTTLNSLTTFNGKKYFLNYAFEEGEQHLFCGFPSCDFKLAKTSEDAEDCDNMMKHIRKMHPQVKPKPNTDTKRLYKCPHCDENPRKNMVASKFRQHLKSTHPALYDSTLLPQNTCVTCGKSLGLYKSLLLHNWTHFNTDEKRALVAQGFIAPIHYKEKAIKDRVFNCPKCPKVFSVKGNLTSHLYSHLDISEKQKHLCEECGIEYTTKRGIDRHRQLRHDPNSLIAKWHQCLICDKKYLVKTHLTVHIARHHGGEKIHQCEECGHRFPSKHSLVRHKISHNPVEWRPFKCDLCPEAYRYIKNLHRHIAKSHGQEFVPLPKRPPLPPGPPVLGCKRMYPCPICEKLFELPSRLTKHLKTSHDKDGQQSKSKPRKKAAPPPPETEDEDSDYTDEEELEQQEQEIYEQIQVGVEEFNVMLGFGDVD